MPAHKSLSQEGREMAKDDIEVAMVIEEIVNLLEGLKEGVIENYKLTKEFEEDACAYCREQGWREPS